MLLNIVTLAEEIIKIPYRFILHGTGKLICEGQKDPKFELNDSAVPKNTQKKDNILHFERISYVNEGKYTCGEIIDYVKTIKETVVTVYGKLLQTFVITTATIVSVNPQRYHYPQSLELNSLIIHASNQYSNI